MEKGSQITEGVDQMEQVQFSRIFPPNGKPVVMIHEQQTTTWFIRKEQSNKIWQGRLPESLPHQKDNASQNNQHVIASDTLSQDQWYIQEEGSAIEFKSLEVNRVKKTTLTPSYSDEVDIQSPKIFSCNGAQEFSQQNDNLSNSQKYQQQPESVRGKSAGNFYCCEVQEKSPEKQPKKTDICQPINLQEERSGLQSHLDCQEIASQNKMGEDIIKRNPAQPNRQSEIKRNQNQNEFEIDNIQNFGDLGVQENNQVVLLKVKKSEDQNNFHETEAVEVTRNGNSTCQNQVICSRKQSKSIQEISPLSHSKNYANSANPLFACCTIQQGTPKQHKSIQVVEQSRECPGHNRIIRLRIPPGDQEILTHSATNEENKYESRMQNIQSPYTTLECPKDVADSESSQLTSEPVKKESKSLSFAFCSVKQDSPKVMNKVVSEEIKGDETKQKGLFAFCTMPESSREICEGVGQLSVESYPRVKAASRKRSQKIENKKIQTTFGDTNTEMGEGEEQENYDYNYSKKSDQSSSFKVQDQSLNDSNSKICRNEQVSFRSVATGQSSSHNLRGKQSSISRKLNCAVGETHENFLERNESQCEPEVNRVYAILQGRDSQAQPEKQINSKDSNRTEDDLVCQENAVKCRRQQIFQQQVQNSQQNGRRINSTSLLESFPDTLSLNQGWRRQRDSEDAASLVNVVFCKNCMEFIEVLQAEKADIHSSQCEGLVIITTKVAVEKLNTKLIKIMNLLEKLSQQLKITKFFEGEFAEDLLSLTLPTVKRMIKMSILMAERSELETCIISVKKCIKEFDDAHEMNPIQEATTYLQILNAVPLIIQAKQQISGKSVYLKLSESEADLSQQSRVLAANQKSLIFDDKRVLELRESKLAIEPRQLNLQYMS